ncbi:hypothetical protein M2189_004840 [Bradyrhizobium japonicum]|nr:hypothetical protein [Bradyrhizobium japonicum]MCS3961637.1 hypothetical protein [Bradyrhizobium japonicum]MCS3993953.1 hypothetical protein [Bradyrhizobium japonicum]
MCVIFEPRPSSAGELPACKAKSAGMATGIMHTRRRWAAGRVTGLSLPDGQNTREGVKPRLQQYSTLPKFGNDVCVVHPGSPRGAILCRHCREPGLRWTRQRWAREVRAGRIALREPKTSCRMSGAARLRLVCKFPAPSTGLEKLRRNGGPCVRQNRVGFACWLLTLEIVEVSDAIPKPRWPGLGWFVHVAVPAITGAAPVAAV